MAVLDKGMKQRMVGAVVLIALAVIFLPMLFTREDETRQVQVEAPAAPSMPSQTDVQVTPVDVPEPQAVPDLSEQPGEVIDESTAPASTPSQPIAPAPDTAAKSTSAATVAPSKPATASPPVTQATETKAPSTATASQPAADSGNKLDANGLPISWSIQLASLSSRAGADKLQSTLRGQGYTAYIRSAGGLNRVFVGPVIDRAEAERVRDAINRSQKLKGIVVRYQPERN